MYRYIPTVVVCTIPSYINYTIRNLHYYFKLQSLELDNEQHRKIIPSEIDSKVVIFLQ